MINFQDAKILFSAIANMENTYFSNMKDGDMVRRSQVFDILNSLFEDGVKIVASRNAQMEIIGYEMHSKNV